MGGIPEQYIQEQAAHYLRSKGALFCHAPNGGKRSARVGAELKKSGVSRGVPDLLVFAPVQAAIEIKTERGRVSPEQRAWLDALEAAGWRVYITRGLGQTLDTLKELIP
jgi:hypothetical protein